MSISPYPFDDTSTTLKIGTAITMVKCLYPPLKDSDDCPWRRRVSKDRAAVKHWDKESTSGAARRRWFGYAPNKWDGLRCCYHTELEANQTASALLFELAAAQQKITWLFGAKDKLHNNAVMLTEYQRTRGTR